VPALRGPGRAVTCDECKGEHVLTGEVRVDGREVDPRVIECWVETACKYGLLRPRVEPVGEAAMVEPDVPLRQP